MVSEVRQWVDKFTHWYNEEHHHSGIRYVTPGNVTVVKIIPCRSSCPLPVI
ncbi:integrase core domain-containing protein [Mangrovibacter phragmitis]|uniref:integrase core domain-containing protein n=1 Tax=Mangrovibacter phragmitis TaxID=1691903 RepID=UPI0038620BDF